jgi:hypothetical protein
VVTNTRPPEIERRFSRQLVRGRMHEPGSEFMSRTLSQGMTGQDVRERNHAEGYAKRKL